LRNGWPLWLCGTGTIRGELEGNKLLRLVYLDEAGLSKPSQEPFLVVAGVIVDPDRKLIAIERHIARIAQRYLPEEHLAGFVFHAAELFNGGGKVFERKRPNFIGPIEWPIERRLLIADELAKIPRKFDLDIALGWINRQEVADIYELPKDITPAKKTIVEHVLSYAQAAAMVEHWMRENASDEVCLLIAEDNSQSRSFIRDTQNFYQDPEKVPALKDYHESDLAMHFPFRKIKEDPLFQPKKPSNPLIIADFCAYVFKKFMMKDERYNRFFDPMREKLISFDYEKLRLRNEKRARRSHRSLRSNANERPQ